MVLIVAPPAAEVEGPAAELGAAPVELAGAAVVVGAALEEPAALVGAALVLAALLPLLLPHAAKLTSAAAPIATRARDFVVVFNGIPFELGATRCCYGV